MQPTEFCTTGAIRNRLLILCTASYAQLSCKHDARWQNLISFVTAVIANTEHLAYCQSPYLFFSRKKVSTRTMARWSISFSKTLACRHLKRNYDTLVKNLHCVLTTVTPCTDWHFVCFVFSWNLRCVYSGTPRAHGRSPIAKEMW